MEPDPGLARRLFVAFLLVAATAMVCWLVLPHYGLLVPWYVPVLAFVVIAVAALSPALERRDEDDDEQEDDGPPSLT